MSVFVHPQSLCESKNVGDGTRVWAFAHLLPGAVVGRDCNICDHVFIENDVVIGDRVTIKSGVQLWDGIRVGNDVFIGPNATLTNDAFPRSKKYPSKFPKTVLEDGCSVGANATILPGLVVGRNAMVGAGAVVTKSVPPNAIVAGNPARIHSYASSGEPLEFPRTAADAATATTKKLAVAGASLHRLPAFEDIRGRLVAGEIDKELPFLPARFFLVYGVPSKEVRGEHAHRSCHQYLICVSGSVNVVVDDGRYREEVVLNSPQVGLHLKPLVWGTQYKYTSDAALLVLASHHYDASDYIRDYDEWLELTRHLSSAT